MAAEFEQRLETAAPFIEQANAIANGLPRMLEDMNLWNVMASSVEDDTHLLIAMMAGLSGESHGDHNVEAKKYVIPNKGFYKHIDTMINGGLWTPDRDIVYQSPETIDSNKALGLSLPNLDKEKVIFAEGEKNADKIMIAGATFDGIFNRVHTSIELVKNGSQARQIVVMSGPRQTEVREGESGRYKQFTSEPEKSVTELFPMEYDSAKAIVSKLFDAVQTDTVTDNTEAGNKRSNEMASVFSGKVDDKDVTVTVINGMPVVEAQAVSRSNSKALPRIPVTLEEYIQVSGITSGVWSYVSSFPHRNRIAIEGIKKVHLMGLGGDIKIFPQGKMSVPDKVTAGLHMGEVYPIMQNTRELVRALGLPVSLLVSTSRVVASYMQTQYGLNR